MLRISFLTLGILCFALSGCERHKFEDVKGLYEGHGSHKEHGEDHEEGHHEAEGVHPAHGETAPAEKHPAGPPVEAEKAPAAGPKDVGL